MTWTDYLKPEERAELDAADELRRLARVNYNRRRRRLKSTCENRKKREKAAAEKERLDE